MRQVAALFVRADSIYKTMPGVDCYDIERDARTWQGGVPGIFHPPCRLWSSMRHFSTAPLEEKELARWSVQMVRENGGVLEHPRGSGLWPEMGLPASGRHDAFGGFTVGIFQGWWGHRADKPTLLYVVGCKPANMPPMPMRLGMAERVVSPWHGFRKGMLGWRPHLRKDERQATPPLLAEWLVDLARRTSVIQAAA